MFRRPSLATADDSRSHSPTEITVRGTGRKDSQTEANIRNARSSVSPRSARTAWSLQVTALEHPSVESFATCACEKPHYSRSEAASDSLPQYCEDADEPNEPETVAYKLFLYGFLFPPVWIFGSLILCMPLRSYPMPEAAPGQPPIVPVDISPENIALYRRAEKHWALRCAWAFTALTLILTVLIFAIIGMRIF